MPVVLKDVDSVSVQFGLRCAYKRASVLADALSDALYGDAGFLSAKDITCGFDYHAVVEVYYASLADAARLDNQVRSLLSRKVV